MAVKIIEDPTREEMLACLTSYGCDEFEAEAAIYWFANDYHGGQDTNLYSALSTSPYTPGPCQRGVQGSLAEIAYEVLEEHFVVVSETSNQL